MHFLDPELIPDDKAFTLKDAAKALKRLEDQVNQHFIGLGKLVRRLIESVIMGEHCLIEGSPGLAKTRVAKVLAARLGLSFNRIQFVPDLMPSDLLYRERLVVNKAGKASVRWMPGPVFTNLLLADEINRASPKAQAALLEVTEERQVTPMYKQKMVIRPRRSKHQVGEASMIQLFGPFYGEKLIDPNTFDGQQFTVVATMNPIEQEGVFPLSEAQLDRFAFKVIVDYPGYFDLNEIGCEAFERDDDSHNGLNEKAEDLDELHRCHVRTLYFLTRLRRLLYGPEVRRFWMPRHEGEEGTNEMSIADQDIQGKLDKLRVQASTLVDFTHFRVKRDDPGDFDRPTAAPVATGTNREQFPLPIDAQPGKNSDLQVLLKWLDKTGDKEANAWRKQVARELSKTVTSDGYPEVISGASPRGLIKLIRAACAEALLDESYSEVPIDGKKEVRLIPEWLHFDKVARDVLRHRIRLSGSSIADEKTSEDVIEQLCACLKS